MGLCDICTAADAKYKCPACEVPYCLIKCYKSELHKHEEKPKVAPSPPPEKPPSQFDLIANDKRVKKLLGENSLQVHLGILVKILTDSDVTNEPIAENRRDLANMRLCSLRKGGSEVNELVEEFCQLVVELLQSNE